MAKIVKQHENWIDTGRKEQEKLEAHWHELSGGERRRAELVSRLHLSSGYANYRMAEWEHRDAGQRNTIFEQTFDRRLDEAAKDLSKADAAHPNHYLVLQLLGLVYSEPRRERMDLGVAEQYFERANIANPSDYYGHELLAGIILRRVANRTVDLASRATIEKGRAEAQKAIDQRETSGAPHICCKQSS